MMFFFDLKKYYFYLICYVKCLEKSKVSNTFLGYLWWIIDPLLHMVIYTILSRIVFDVRHDYYPVFFFSAMLIWRYFSTVMIQSADILQFSLHLCRDNYVPKFVFPLAVCITTLNPFFFSLLLLLGIMLICGLVPPITIFITLPILVLALFFFTFASSLIVAHIGILFLDFSVILPHILMLGMFGTPIFWDRAQVSDKYQIFIYLNPIAFFTESSRKIFLEGQVFSYEKLLIVLASSLFIFFIGIYIFYSYDQKYNRIKM